MAYHGLPYSIRPCPFDLHLEGISLTSFYIAFHSIH